MTSKNITFPAVVIALLVLLPFSCWGVHRSHHTLPRGSDESIEGTGPHRGATDHELEPAIAPRGKHFSWHSSWQRGKKVTVLAIEPDALRDRRSVLRHNVTRHNVRHRHGFVPNQSNSNNSAHSQEDYLQKAPDRPTFPLRSGSTKYNKDNAPGVAEVPGNPVHGDFITLQELHNYVNVDEGGSRDNDNHLTPNVNPYTRMKTHTSDRSDVIQFETEPIHNSKRDHKPNRNFRLNREHSGGDAESFHEQLRDVLSHKSHEILTFQKSANAREKFTGNNNRGYRKIVPALKESGQIYDERENEIEELEGELIEFLERRRRDDGTISLEKKSERVRRRRERRKSRIEKRRQRRRERNKLRRRPISGGGGEQGDAPLPATDGENRRVNGTGRSREGEPINPARKERKRQRIADRRKRRRERRLRRKEKQKRGRSLDLSIAGLNQDNKSMLNGSNACQFRDLLRCARETFARDTGPKPADTIPRCKQRKSFLTCMQQQRTSRGDCSPSVKALGDLQALRKYIREAMFTNSSCIIAESITG